MVTKATLFDDKFIDDLSDNPVAAAREVCAKILQHDREWDDQTRLANYENYLVAFGILDASDVAPLLRLKFPVIGTSKEQNIQIVRKTAEVVLQKAEERLAENITKNTLDWAKTLYGVRFGKLFCYEFSDADFARIQDLINELHDLLAACESLDPKPRDRILKRFEYFRNDLHKKMNDLDKFWGLYGDAGILFGKIGNDAKPYVDRITEITDIVWRTQARAENIPSSVELPL